MWYGVGARSPAPVFFGRRRRGRGAFPRENGLLALPQTLSRTIRRCPPAGGWQDGAGGHILPRLARFEAGDETVEVDETQQRTRTTP